MIELAKHIEVLLLENDCVIVPGLGGFIAHNRQAEYREAENQFSAPARTIGFNPQLVMNDGLLVQTYMQAYHTDFPDATRKIEKLVSTLKEQLYLKGEVCLPNVGTLYYTMNGTYVFEPSSDTFFTPYLYGLDSLKMMPLQAIATQQEEVIIHPFIRPSEAHTQGSLTPEMPVAYKRVIRRMAQHTVGIAAAILLFFLLSVPVENTYMDDASYASLGGESMFDAIRSRSAATQLVNTTDKEQNKQKVQRTKSNVNTLRPVRVKSEYVAPTPSKETKASKEAKTNKGAKVVKQETKETVSVATPAAVEKPSAVQSKSLGNYHIIVASLATTADAQKQLKKFQDKGFTDASILESGDRHRIALYSYSKQAEAYKKLKELRTQDEFQSAWIFTSK